MIFNNLPEGLIDETVTLSLEEFCQLLQADEHLIIEMVEIGVLEPLGKEKLPWRFTLIQIQRFQKALRLQHDLKMNLQGVALSLELLDQIQTLEAQIQDLEFQLRLLNKS